jgi:UDP-N-acetyl-D-mannosaminuronic acid dehydrogenase
MTSRHDRDRPQGSDESREQPADADDQYTDQVPHESPDGEGRVPDASVPESDTRTRLGLYGSDRPDSVLQETVRQGRVPTAVYGLGKMGMPIAAAFAALTGNTTGVDIDQTVVDAVQEGRAPVANEPGLPQLVAHTVDEGSLTATTDGRAAARQARVHVVIVPTLVENGTPDLSNLRAVVHAVADGLEPGDLVCIESTVPPRTTTDVVEPTLVDRSDCDRDEFGLAFCPERTASGRALRDIGGSYPKIVGGVDDESTRAARVLYDLLTTNEVVSATDATTAEAVKVFEGVYRDVNIALANELATFADELGIDVREAITAANTQPYCDLHRPGPGVGGHCIPYYPHFLIKGFETASPLLEQARYVNDSMPAYTVARLVGLFEERPLDITDATVGVLGIAYRPGVAETRESPGLAVAELLDEIGVDVCAADPVVDVREYGLSELTGIPGTDQQRQAAGSASSGDEVGVGRPDAARTDLRAVDALVLTTPHGAFEDIPWPDLPSQAVVDCHGAFDIEDTHHDVTTIGVARE